MGGFAGGAIDGFGSAAIAGAGFGDATMSGLNGGLIGGVTGGVISGIEGGFDVMSHGGNFFTGNGATYANWVTSDVSMDENGLPYNDDYAKKFSDMNYGNVKGLKNLHANGSVPKGGYEYKDGFISKDGKEAWGVTQKVKGGYDVYLSGGAFNSKERLFLTMGHEYMHIGFNMAGLRNTLKQHAAIYNWEYLQANALNFNVTEQRNIFYYYNQFSSAKYDFTKLGFQILLDPKLIWY